MYFANALIPIYIITQVHKDYVALRYLPTINVRMGPTLLQF